MKIEFDLVSIVSYFTLPPPDTPSNALVKK